MSDGVVRVAYRIRRWVLELSGGKSGVGSQPTQLPPGGMGLVVISSEISSGAMAGTYGQGRYVAQLVLRPQLVVSELQCIVR